MESKDQTHSDLIGEAAEWLVGLDGGTADSAEFEAWRSADPRRAAAFAQVAATWRRTGELRGQRPAAPPVPAPIAAPRAPVLGRRTLLRGMAAGGIGVVAVGSAALLLAPRRAMAETARGERRTVALPDGSRAELNTDTRLEWRFDERRALWLERGEAAFTVADDLARPMLVAADAARAALERGRYLVRCDAASVRLTVLAGRARVAFAGADAVVAPGEQLIAANGRMATRTLDAAAIAAAAAWRRGEIHFDGMTLGEAVREYNRYLGRPLAIDDVALAGTRLGGRFLIDDPEGFLQALRDGFGIEHRREGDRIVLRAASDAAQQNNLPRG